MFAPVCGFALTPYGISIPQNTWSLIPGDVVVGFTRSSSYTVDDAVSCEQYVHAL